jgi:hypothetical protein
MRQSSMRELRAVREWKRIVEATERIAGVVEACSSQWMKRGRASPWREVVG